MCSREREEEIRATVAETGIINQTIAEKDEEMADLKEQAAQQKLAQQSQAAASSSTGASKAKTAGNAGDSPRSNMSSPWATDVRMSLLCSDQHPLFIAQSPFHAMSLPRPAFSVHFTLETSS